MAAILNAIISFFTSKVGGIAGFILNKVLQYGGQLLLDIYNNWRRDQEQKKALKKVEEDVQNKTPRNDETKTHEKDWMNS